MHLSIGNLTVNSQRHDEAIRTAHCAGWLEVIMGADYPSAVGGGGLD